MPIRNVGRLTPTSERRQQELREPAVSAATRCRRRAECRRTARAIAAAADSSSVAGSRSLSSVDTERPCRSETAEIALHRVADEPGELHDERLVEAELGAKRAPSPPRSRPGPP